MEDIELLIVKTELRQLLNQRISENGLNWKDELKILQKLMQDFADTMTTGTYTITAKSNIK